jgi:hypothetical protein
MRMGGLSAPAAKRRRTVTLDGLRITPVEADRTASALTGDYLMRELELRPGSNVGRLLQQLLEVNRSLLAL